MLTLVLLIVSAAPAAAQPPRDPAPMVSIPEGCITVEEKKVCLTPYRIDKTEVTVGQFRRCVAARRLQGPRARPAAPNVAPAPNTAAARRTAPSPPSPSSRRSPTAPGPASASPPKPSGPAPPPAPRPAPSPGAQQRPSCERAAIKQCLKRQDGSAPVCSRPAGNSPGGRLRPLRKRQGVGGRPHLHGPRRLGRHRGQGHAPPPLPRRHLGPPRLPLRSRAVAHRTV